jgi:predicted molibdopterin-dependent oxidoreductase YjgC
MFRLIDNNRLELVEVELDGKPVKLPAGISVAAALLQIDAIPFRQSPVGGMPRAPFCMMGACFECLLEIDGRCDQRACQVEVQAGMRVRRQLFGHSGSKDD